jgi:class 3 adenylate cyclase
LDESKFAYTNSLLNPGFIDSDTKHNFKQEFNQSALSNARILLFILIIFWCAFVWFDLLLTPETKYKVIKFRFLIILPLFLALGGISFSKAGVRIYQAWIILFVSLISAAAIGVVVLYDDFGLVAKKLGYELVMPDQDARFIFVCVWMVVAFFASVSLRIRTRPAIVLSIIMVMAVFVSVHVFSPSFFIVAIAVSFILVCVSFVVAGSLMMQRLAVSNYRSAKLLEQSSKELESTLELLKTMFGRYLSTEVMATLIENPSALELGGEKRLVTIMMTDLRGFTAMSERLEPEKVVQILNAYFEIMVAVALKFQGTINEIIGDALLIVFGAPQEMPDRTQRAVACAIEMQNAMARVNSQNRSTGLPELEMGIGLNETEVIVGNIGSSKRSKYTVVGSGVNMTSRIESYSVGGQVLISESVFKKTGHILSINSQQQILPKGAETPFKIYEVVGIAGAYNFVLEKSDSSIVPLIRQIPLVYSLLEGKSVNDKGIKGSIIQLSKKSARIFLDERVEILSNLKMNLKDVDENLAQKDFYGKVVDLSDDGLQIHLVRFTSVPAEIDAYFQSHRQHSEKIPYIKKD